MAGLDGGTAVGSIELDEFRVEQLVGRGGMGDVYRAYDALLDRPVAIKFIRSFESGAVAKERFFLEARSAARVHHPNVCVVYRVGEWNGQPYIVSEFVEGKSLSLLELPLAESEVIEIGIGVARGLAAAHRQGILHRDIKPANVLRSKAGEIKLVDFGLAELTRDAGVTTADTMTADTVAKGSLAEGPVVRARTVDAAPAANASKRPGDFSQREMTASARSRDGTRFRALSNMQAPRLSALGVASRWVAGTPDYIAPELWSGARASRQSDVYALGALLYELCIGEPPFGSFPIDELPHVTQAEDRSIAALDPTVDAHLAEVVDRCLCRDLARRYASADEVRDALEQLLPDRNPRNVPEGNPYRGLRPFEAEHGALFFGRNREVRALVDRMRSDQVVVVAGDSGLGKSSICRAGVIPCIHLGALGERRWTVLTLVPGKRPLAALDHVLATAFERRPAENAGYVSAEFPPGSWAGPVSGSGGDGLVLFVDQLEELISLADDADARRFCDRLDVLLLSNQNVRLLATVRSDFLARVASLPALGDRIGRALYVLQPMNPDGIREAVVGPASVKGFRYESEVLVNELVSATKDTEGGLPLLQFALTELWECRVGASKTIPAAALERIGGVGGALTRHADAVVANMLPRAQASARSILLSLVTSAGSRSRKGPLELGADDVDTRLALEALVQARLLVARESEVGVVYEVAHEALLVGWGRLAGWLDDSVQIRAARDRILASTTEWERLGQPADALWSERQLKEIAPLELGELPRKETAFLATSKANIQRRHRRVWALAVGVPVLVVLLVMLSILRERRENARRIEVQLDDAKRILSDVRERNRAINTAKAEALSLFRLYNRENAERKWAQVLDQAKTTTQRYREASQRIEAALVMDHSNREARRLLADVLFERALIAERDGRAEEKEELLKRLPLFDDGNKRTALWSAPGTVTITTNPPGANAELEIYERDVQGRMKGRRLAVDGPTPVSRPVSLAPGSYRLTFSLGGYATVRYPFVVMRGEKQTISVRLPRAEEVPDGFVYVPPGRGTFGSTVGEELRGWFMTAPEQQIHTNGFFIRRDETTMGEWLEYLESLTPAERQARAPEDGVRLRRGSLRLDRIASKTWQLTFWPAAHRYIVKSDERLTYIGRERRATQTWTRFPISGISFQDAIAYSQYLQTRAPVVRGARLCTEYEWERAARGADRRMYPHGDHMDIDDANFDATYGQNPMSFGPDEVGSHPASRSLFDVDDMAGNVWEWVIGMDAPSAVRGGSYYDQVGVLYSANRDRPETSYRDPTVGLRICADAPWGP